MSLDDSDARTEDWHRPCLKTEQNPPARCSIPVKMEAGRDPSEVTQGRNGPMLVLSRKIGEKVVIGDGIVVVVKRIHGQRVTFGIEAPETVRIVRGELPRFEDAPAPLLSAHDELHAAMSVHPR